MTDRSTIGPKIAWNSSPVLGYIDLLMRRHVVLLITLFYLFGTVGIPVVAYSCAESGEAGMVAYFSGSPGVCYADSCCDGGQNPPNDRIQSEIPCCDLSVQIAPENNRILLPGKKYGQANQLADTPSRFFSSRSDARIAPTLPPISVFHASINLPLLI
jgi:hypothetical protein